MNKYGIEFHTSPEGEILIKQDGEPMRELTEHDTELILDLFDRIRRDYPEAFKCLSETYRKSEKNILYFRFLCVRRFIRCNFGNYDTLTDDIDTTGQFHFEQVQCPLRGECTGYKIICSPKYNTKLSSRELQVLEMYVKPMEMADIADTLCISPFTVDQHVRSIRAKTGCKSKAELINMYNKTH
jgi:DNA-binding CsgD family transcriptional regulator